MLAEVCVSVNHTEDLGIAKIESRTWVSLNRDWFLLTLYLSCLCSYSEAIPARLSVRKWSDQFRAADESLSTLRLMSSHCLKTLSNALLTSIKSADTTLGMNS